MNAHRGVCSNGLRIRRDVIERVLLQKMRAEVLRKEVVEYTLKRFEAELVKRIDNLGDELGQMRQRKAKLKEEIRHLTNVIADGYYSPSVMGEIASRERELAKIADRLLESHPDSVRSRLKDIRTFVVSRLSDLQSLLNSDVIRARTELAKHIQEIKLVPSGKMYKAFGSWDLIGEGRMEGAAGRS